MDQDKIRNGLRQILEGIGENPKRPGLVDTPDRVAKLYADLFSGVGSSAAGEACPRFSVADPCPAPRPRCPA